MFRDAIPVMQMTFPSPAFSFLPLAVNSIHSFNTTQVEQIPLALIADYAQFLRSFCADFLIFFRRFFMH